jgi:hypothetical protein
VSYHLIASLFSIFLLRSSTRDKDLLEKRLFSPPELFEKAIFCFCRINVFSLFECLEKTSYRLFDVRVARKSDLLRTSYRCFFVSMVEINDSHSSSLALARESEIISRFRSISSVKSRLSLERSIVDSSFECSKSTIICQVSLSYANQNFSQESWFKTTMTYCCLWTSWTRTICLLCDYDNQKAWRTHKDEKKWKYHFFETSWIRINNQILKERYYQISISICLLCDYKNQKAWRAYRDEKSWKYHCFETSWIRISIHQILKNDSHQIRFH